MYFKSFSNFIILLLILIIINCDSHENRFAVSIKSRRFCAAILGLNPFVQSSPQKQHDEEILSKYFDKYASSHEWGKYSLAIFDIFAIFYSKERLQTWRVGGRPDFKPVTGVTLII